MFRRITENAEHFFTIFIDGAQISARAGDSVAAAMLAAGYIACRTTALSGARGPYCLTGVCFECLVTIDSVANLQGCMTRVRDGMRIETQRGNRTLGT